MVIHAKYNKLDPYPLCVGRVNIHPLIIHSSLATTPGEPRRNVHRLYLLLPQVLSRESSCLRSFNTCLHCTSACVEHIELLHLQILVVLKISLFLHRQPISKCSPSGTFPSPIPVDNVPHLFGVPTSSDCSSDGACCEKCYAYCKSIANRGSAHL